jgi:UDP-N-acetylmuramate dehydrogenase
VTVSATAVERAAGILGPLGERDVPLGPLTTYRVGGPAALMARVDRLADLTVVHRAVAATDLPVLVVGRGSNLLVSDDGFPGLAVVLGGFALEVTVDGTEVVAGGAVSLPVLARQTVAAGLTGLEWAVGVPGSVGGGVRMNAGGHGSDIATTVMGVRVFDLRSGEDCVVPASALGLRFRGSDLADHQVVVTARFALAPGHRVSSQAVLSEIVHWRREHQPGGQNAGSVFVNPVPGELSAGEVIDGLGLRGLRIGSAEVSPKHANFIQADEGGRAGDVRAVMAAVRARVLEERGIALRSEIRQVGFDMRDDGVGDREVAS